MKLSQIALTALPALVLWGCAEPEVIADPTQCTPGAPDKPCPCPGGGGTGTHHCMPDATWGPCVPCDLPTDATTGDTPKDAAAIDTGAPEVAPEVLADTGPTCGGPPAERLCDGACAPCPTAAGIAETECRGAACVAAVCAPGFYPCEAPGCCGWALDEPYAEPFPHGGMARVAVDQGGRVHLAFRYESADMIDQGVVWMRREGAQWQTSAAPTPDGAALLRLGARADGGAVLGSITTVENPGLGYVLELRRFDTGGAMTDMETFPSGAAPAPADPAAYTGLDLALDEPGGEHLVLRDEGSGQARLLALWPNPSALEGWGIKPLASDIGMGLPAGCESIAVDGAGKAHVVYVDGLAPALMHAFQGSAWKPSPIEPGEMRAPSIALGPGASPRVAYAELGSHEIRFAALDGPWQIDLVASFAGADPRIALALDADDRPHLVYFDEALGGAPIYATRFEGHWWTSPVAEGARAGAVDIAVDQTGRVHIVFEDLDASRAKYAQQ